jgi:hypothetical protein
VDRRCPAHWNGKILLGGSSSEGDGRSNVVLRERGKTEVLLKCLSLSEGGDCVTLGSCNLSADRLRQILSSRRTKKTSIEHCSAKI